MKHFLEKVKGFRSHWENTTWFNKLKEKHKNKDYYIFFVFLLISTGFWFLNALRDNYTTSFSYPLRYVNVPVNEIIVEASERSIRLKVRATGFTILRQYISNTFLPVNFDVAQMRRMNKDGKNYAFILSREQRNTVLDQLFMGMELMELSPDTIFLTLDRVIEKKVPIKFMGELSYEKQFMLSGSMLFTPDSVTISGPVSIVDSILLVNTQAQVFDRLRDTLRKKVTLEYIRGISLKPSEVNLMVPVESFSEKTLTVPVEVIGLPDSLWLKTFPPEIGLTFRAGLSRFDRISHSEFRAIVDAETALGNERPARLRVRIDKMPEGIESVDFSPLYVEYLIERRR